MGRVTASWEEMKICFPDNDIKKVHHTEGSDENRKKVPTP